MALILGIDAAWTPKGSSGVALVRAQGKRRELVACAPSYEGFLGCSEGEKVEWVRPPGGAPKVPALLKAASKLGGDAVDVVAIDMPVAAVRITGRRVADREVSQAFGAVGAPVHTPTVDRPGAFGFRMTKELVGEGFALATKGVVAGTIPALVEVYPLAALVRLLGYKPNYKTARLRRYLKNVPKEKGEDPITWLLEQWEPILDALGREVREAKVPIPDRGAVSFVSRLKPYEDALDAIVSAWVGALYVEGRAEAFGDETAAIWIPRAR